MNTSKFTQKFQEVIAATEKLVNQNGNQQTDKKHLLSALLVVSDSLTASFIAKMGIQKEAFLDESEALIQKLSKVSGGDQEYVSADLNCALNDTKDEAKAMGDDYVPIEHLFLGLLKNPSHALKEPFRAYDTTHRKFLQALSTVRGSQRVTSDNLGATYDTLNKYGYDLVEHARDQEFDPVIGRDEEIRNVTRILSRKTKSDPILTGELGAGKTVVIEGPTQRIACGDISEGFKDKRLFALDMGALVAGAKCRDEFGERPRAVFKEVRKSEGEVIPFIDELHTIVGVGVSEGSMDAGNMLKPMFARGELHCIGTTTLGEYRKYIKKDLALERRFQPVLANQSTVGDTISILRGLKERYENYHHVKIQDGVLTSAVVFSDRYITDRFLPDKAIDLVDEACVMIKTEPDSLPVELGEMNRRRMQLEVEATALQEETDNLSKGGLEATEKELTKKKVAFAEAKARWENEKASISKLAEIQQQIEDTNHEIQAA